MSSRPRYYLTWVAASLCVALQSTSARAADTNPAAAHFSRGVALVKEGDLVGAASEFESAHRISPHPATLYNLGQTYASLGRSLEAVTVLKRYLAEASQVSPARRAEVTNLIALHQRRIGKLAVTVQPRDAELRVDGKLIPPDTALSAFEVVGGPHAVLVRKEGFAPAAVSAQVRAGETAQVTLELVPLKAARTAQLQITCAVPDAVWYLDGELVGRAPFEQSFPVAPGEHDLRFSRPGYETQTQRVDVETRASVSCALSPRASLSLRDGAALRVRGAPEQATVLVDGERHTGQILPSGAHVVTVQSLGYRPFRETVTLAQGRTTFLDVELTPTREERARLTDESRSRRRTYAYVGAGVGAALCGVGGVLYAISSKRYDEFEADNRQLSRELASRAATQADYDRMVKLSSDAAAIERMNVLALSSGLVGGALLGGSTILYFSSTSHTEGGQSAMLRAEGRF